MLLDATSISDFQSCQRRYVLGLRWRPVRWKPRRLFTGCLIQGILSIVQDRVAPREAAANARARFLQSAADPGLDITTDPFLAAKDWCAMLETILRSLAREGLPKSLVLLPPVNLNSYVTWETRAYSDNNMLHRWVMVDYWREDDLARELHSWRTLGDIATTTLPMTIHVIEIGRMHKGRRASLWARSWRHPTMPNLGMRFKGKLPGTLKGWKPMYLADARVDPDAWVEHMWKEGAAQDLVHHIPVKVPSEMQRGVVVKDILSEAVRMRELAEEDTPWSVLPMSRNSCDGLSPCPFQHVCYANEPVQVEKLGIYQLRELDLIPTRGVRRLAS